MKIKSVGLCFVCSVAAWAFAAGTALAEMKEYESALVLMVDHPAGLLGVQVEPEGATEPVKYSFTVDAADVSVVDPANRPVEFTDVHVGDGVDIMTVVREDGTEAVDQIYIYAWGGGASRQAEEGS